MWGLSIKLGCRLNCVDNTEQYNEPSCGGFRTIEWPAALSLVAKQWKQNMISLYRKALSPSPAQSQVDFFDTRAAVEALKPGAYQTLPYTARILAENLERRCPPEQLSESLLQIIERKRDLDFPGIPRAWCATIFSAKPRWLIWRVCVMRLVNKAATPRKSILFSRLS